MKVILAKSAGFCMGVRRAVETTLDVIQREDRGVATFGPLIHNPQVLDLLAERGVRILKEVPAQEQGTIIIRAHGVPPAMKQKLMASGAKLKDATCPRVVRVQAIIKRYKKQGYATVIVGDRNHAEVEGLLGYAEPRGYIVSNDEDVRNLASSPAPLTVPYIIVSQTTQDEEVFAELGSRILELYPGGELFNTICGSTHKRQEEVRSLCGRVEAMVVVGGRSSANTQRLAEIAAGLGCRVFNVETEDELDWSALATYDCIGVTAGASTPTWLINRVARTIEVIPGRGESRLKHFVYKVLLTLLATNLYVSLGGGLLAYICGFLQFIEPQFSHFMIASNYLFAMHNFNRFTDPKAKKFSDPVRALFYDRYRWPLLIIASLALAAAIVVSYDLGRRPFLMLTGMSILGIMYSVYFIPKSFLPVTRVRRLKEIPGSKTIFVAMAWGFVTTIIPAWGSGLNAGPATVGVLTFVVLLVYVRSALFDVFDIQADRILGKETLPVLIGEKRTISLLNFLMALLIILLLALPAFAWISGIAFWLIPAIVYLVVLARLYTKEQISPGPKLDFCLESTFYLTAGLAWLGALW